MRSTMIFLAAIALWMLSLVKSSHAANTKPHIVIVVIDDFGWGDAGYHGAPFATPNIDRLAGEGVKLDNFYVQPMCTPTRAALLTGRFPIRYGLQHDVIQPRNPAGLSLNETLIPEVLRDNGYTTHLVGKWHLGFFKNEYTPIHRGFDTFFGFYNSAENHFSNEIGGGLDLRRQNRPVYNKEQIYSTHLYTHEAIDIIRNHDQSKPMFMYLAYQACHGPLQAPQPYLDRCAHIKGSALRKKFCAMALTVDEGLQNVTQALERAGMWNDTLFVFMTDNGAHPANAGNNGGSNWPLRGTKFTFFEGGVRVPAFVHGNMLSDSVIGTTNNMLMHVTDVFPTIMEAAGIDYVSPKPMDGVSAWKAINTKSPSRTEIRSEILINIDPDQNTYSVIVGDLKLIYGRQEAYSWYNAPNGAAGGANVKPNGATLVFNITADPIEAIDLSVSNRPLVTSLTAVVNKYRRTMVSNWNPPEDLSADPATHGGYWSPWLSAYNVTAAEELAPWEGDKSVLGDGEWPTIAGLEI